MYVIKRDCVCVCMNADDLISPDGGEKETRFQYDTQAICGPGEDTADYET